jgi:hypothetical protein
MNVEIGAEAALFPEKEYISGIFVAVQSSFLQPSFLLFDQISSWMKSWGTCMQAYAFQDTLCLHFPPLGHPRSNTNGGEGLGFYFFVRYSQLQVVFRSLDSTVLEYAGFEPLIDTQKYNKIVKINDKPAF